MTVSTPSAPVGAAWVGEWDEVFHDRVFGGDPVVAGGVGVLLTGVQHRDGVTVSGVALRVEGAVIVTGRQVVVAADLTPEQARELAGALAALADRADALDGVAGPLGNRTGSAQRTRQRPVLEGR